MTTIIAISDTHNQIDALDLPEGDILIHAGDATLRGQDREIEAFDRSLATIKRRYTHGVVMIAGNHDFGFQERPSTSRRLITNATYLQDSEVMVGGLRIYGSPWQPWFHDWAFNLSRGEPLREKWRQIPMNVDILVTHGPPFGYGDRVQRLSAHDEAWRPSGAEPNRVGCVDLLDAVKLKKPRVHVFGHIHEDYGSWQTDDTLFINASSCTLKHAPINKPHVFELEARKEA